MPVSVAGKPLLLVRGRGEDGSGRSTTYARHRCLKLIDTPLQRGARHPLSLSLVDLRPRRQPPAHPLLRAAGTRARRPPGFDRAEHGLAPVRSATWHDWIFVNPDGGAPPFEDFTAPLERRLDGFDLAGLHHLATIDFGEVAANWKLLMENFIEPYHVQFRALHDHRAALWPDHYTVNDAGCLGCAIDVSGEATRDDTPVGERPLPHPVPELRVRVLRSGPDRRTDRPAAGPGPHRPAPRHLFRGAGAGFGRGRRNGSSGSGARCTARITPCANGSSRAAPPKSPAGGGVLSPIWEDSVRTFQGLVVGSLR